MLTDIVCPVCHGSLTEGECRGCGRSYALDGVPDLTPMPPPDPDVRARWSLWERLQANGERSYEIDPPSSLSVGQREDARAFARFSDLEGRVLDVGCGPQAFPSYAEGFGGELVGVDPLVGVQPRRFAFVKGLAEYLPFPDTSFDRVLFATSLDHVLSPRRAVEEARRVLRPDGRVCVWLGELSAIPPLRRLAQRTWHTIGRFIVRQTPMSRAKFEVPHGAVDAFHFMHLDEPTVSRWLRDAGLVVDAVERPLLGHCFLSARRL